MINDYRIVIECPGELGAMVNLIDRSGSYAAIAEFTADRGEDWVRVVCHETGVAADNDQFPMLPGRTTMQDRASLGKLRLMALALINADRSKSGAQPVRLGTNRSAQIHAEDALANDYLVGHWTADGRKPYMLYRQAGGVGTVAENAAGSGYALGTCEEPQVTCRKVDPVAEIIEIQWAMMYDDASSDWGHRRTIINADYDTVNIGIAFSDYQFAVCQHFEYNGLSYVEEPVLEGGLLRLRARPFDGHEIGKISVYHDPVPTPKSPSEIERLTSYCTGGGFTDDCDDVGPVAYVLMPPRSRTYYVGLDPEDVVAGVWHKLGDDSVEIEADLDQLVDRPGVYTIIVWSASEDRRPLSQYSIFQGAAPL